jgi:hypothetical protein
MAQSLDTIASQLPSLKQSDLIKIRQLTDLLIGGGSETQPENEFERMMLEAVKSELAREGVRSAISYKSITESRYANTWRKGVSVTNEFLDTTFKGHIKSDTHKLGLCRVLARITIDELKKREIPISIGTIASNLQRVPQSFDNAFPNYIRSGLAYLVADSMLRRMS